MQIKKKTQLKIELDQNDIVEAVRDFLLKHGQRISDAELAEITFVKSPKDGLRASLDITEETASESEGDVVTDEPESDIETAEESVEAVRDTLAQDPEEEDEPTQSPDEVAEEEAPGEVETSTVEDVMPGVDEIAEMQVDTQEEDAAAALAQRASRSALFQ